jgi:hypothetical protein
VEAELYQYDINTWENIFAVSLEMLQCKDCRLARKHNMFIRVQSNIWMDEAFYGQIQPQHKALNSHSTETTRSMQFNTSYLFQQINDSKGLKCIVSLITGLNADMQNADMMPFVKLINTEDISEYVCDRINVCAIQVTSVVLHSCSKHEFVQA